MHRGFFLLFSVYFLSPGNRLCTDFFYRSRYVYILNCISIVADFVFKEAHIYIYTCSVHTDIHCGKNENKLYHLCMEMRPTKCSFLTDSAFFSCIHGGNTNWRIFPWLFKMNMCNISNSGNRYYFPFTHGLRKYFTASISPAWKDGSCCLDNYPVIRIYLPLGSLYTEYRGRSIRRFMGESVN
jgi:hypothetical protein